VGALKDYGKHGFSSLLTYTGFPMTEASTAVKSEAPRISAPGTIPKDKAIGLWLLVVAVLIGAMVVVGGLTRLTGSGLSITEWRPVTGTLPPMNLADWQAEFARYRGTPQYELLNQGMGLAGFKAIYWWEWSHRLLGRLIGFVLAIPFVYFWVKRRINKPLAIRIGILLLLGGAQGALGWWMVQSGLEPHRVAVSQYRLAAHLGLAIILFGVTLWMALEVLGARRSKRSNLAGFRPWAIGFTVLVFIQMILGAFMSGIKAGLAFDTWPDYAGRSIPLGLYDLQPWWMNHFENPAMVHFQHRTVAYLVALLAVGLWLMLKGVQADKPAQSGGRHIAVLTAIQFLLGILTVAMHVPITVAALHQICALLLFGSGLWLVYTLPKRGQLFSRRGG
jgi:cytochrome c oxidase assembly protein subunit 15